jgi:hypothetical protein
MSAERKYVEKNGASPNAEAGPTISSQPQHTTPAFGRVLRSVIENPALGDELRVLYSVYSQYHEIKTGPAKDHPWVWRPTHLMEACGWSPAKFYRVIRKARKLGILPAVREDYPTHWQWPSFRNETEKAVPEVSSVSELKLASFKNETLSKLISKNTDNPLVESSIRPERVLSEKDGDQSNKGGEGSSEITGKKQNHSAAAFDPDQGEYRRLRGKAIVWNHDLFYRRLNIPCPPELPVEHRTLGNARFDHLAAIVRNEAPEGREKLSTPDLLRRTMLLFADVITIYCAGTSYKKTWKHLCSVDEFMHQLTEMAKPDRVMAQG